MALPLSDASHPLTVDVDVDDVTIVLGILSFFVLDHEADDPLIGISDRVSERLRRKLESLTVPAASV